MPMLQPQGTAGWTFEEPGRQYIKSIPAALPSDRLTPELAISQQINEGKQQIQRKYELQWQEANRSARYLGPAKHKQMLMQIDINAKQEMSEFNQKTQQQLAQLQRIDMMAKQGLIDNADKIKTQMVFGRDVAESIYPERQSVEKLYGTLDIYANKIEDRLAQFRTTKERIPSLLLRKGKEAIAPGEVQIWDRSLTRLVKDKVTGEEVMETGDWRKATETELFERKLLIREQSRIRDLQSEIFQEPSIQKRIVQPGTTGGTFAEKIKADIKPTQQARPKRTTDPLGLFD